jgi:UDP-2-acetamido-3-amino-2,3-dideoxy-glucuronate N-acetyltransferase
VQSSSTFIHPTALVETDRIGSGTRIWAFVHVMPNVTIGRDCNIGDHVFIESNVTLGDDVTVKNGVSIWEHVHIGNHVFLGPNVALTNDRFPRNPHVSYQAEETRIEDGVTIGANATILCGIRLGRRCFIGAGAVVTCSVPPHALVYGNPATQQGWVCECGHPVQGMPEGPIACARCGARVPVGSSGIAGGS